MPSSINKRQLIQVRHNKVKRLLHIKLLFFFLSEKFENATILFTDIVTFTNIASACSPMDIVNLLNELYNRFDQKTNDYEVYKVCLLNISLLIAFWLSSKKAVYPIVTCVE